MSKGGGSAPQPVDPYEQAAAQYGLSTGTAAFNAGLGRTNSSNPIGGSYWSVSGGGSPYGYGGGGGGYPNVGGERNPYYGGDLPGGGGAAPGYATYPYGFGPNPASGVQPTTSGYGGAPRYTQTTTLAPQFESEITTPLDTSQVPGMPGGPSLEGNVQGAQSAAFNQQMDLLAPYEKELQTSTAANLAAAGATPGSPAYNWGEEGLGLQLGAENAQVANNAYLTGIQTLPTLYGLGTTSLQDQIMAQDQPIQEYLALNGGGAPTSPAMTPDISGAFGQQYQGQLAAYNANTASNNATTSDLAGLAGDAIMYAAMMG